MKTFADLFKENGYPLTGDALDMAKKMPYEPTLEEMSQVGIFFEMPRIVNGSHEESKRGGLTTKVVSKINLGIDYFVAFQFENSDGTIPSVMCTEHDDGYLHIRNKPCAVCILSRADSFFKELKVSSKVPVPTIITTLTSDFVEVGD